jgi:sugar lactone lactonase YvrE
MRETTITCPKCGASLPRPRDEGTIECRYCGTAFEREVEPQPVAASPGGSASIYLAIVIPAVLLGVLALVVLVRKSDVPPSPAPVAADPLPAPAPVPTIAPAPTPSASAAPESTLAKFELAFGEKGSGAGQLDDARSIAVDPEGNVFVADYASRRVQKFDSTGKFVAAFRVDEGKQSSMIHGLAATYDGHLWVSRGGDLVELSMPDGKVVRTILNQHPKLSYGGIAVDQTNTLFATNFGATTFVSINGERPQSDDLRKLDKNGNVLAAWKDIIRGALGGAVAVDGAGTVYVSEEHSPYLEIVDGKGKVKERFRLKNHVGGGVAIDGKGRIFYASGRGVGACDATGSELGTFGTSMVRGVAIGKNRLHAVTNDGRVEVWSLR